MQSANGSVFQPGKGIESIYIACPSILSIPCSFLMYEVLKHGFATTLLVEITGNVSRGRFANLKYAESL